MVATKRRNVRRCAEDLPACNRDTMVPTHEMEMSMYQIPGLRTIKHIDLRTSAPRSDWIERVLSTMLGEDPDVVTKSNPIPS